MKWLTDLLGGGLIEGANKLTKTVFGSKEQRDVAAHQEQMSIMGAFAAEFGVVRENRTWWDSAVDGINRLPRPAMTFGIFAVFWYCMIDPIGFQQSMVALQAMPTLGWGVISAVIAFWFGGKFIGKDMQKSKPMDPEKMAKLLETLDSLEAKREARRARLAKEVHHGPENDGVTITQLDHVPR